MIEILYVVAWFACGFLARCACKADFAPIGRSLFAEVLVFLLGPLGLVTAAIATYGFRRGFRL